MGFFSKTRSLFGAKKKQESRRRSMNINRLFTRIIGKINAFTVFLHLQNQQQTHWTSFICATLISPTGHLIHSTS